MSESTEPKTNPKVDVRKCQACGADRGGVLKREGERERLLCFQCEKQAQETGEGGQAK